MSVFQTGSTYLKLIMFAWYFTPFLFNQQVIHIAQSE